MATKAEMEAELARLHKQNEALKSAAEDRSDAPDAAAGASDMHLPAQLQDILEQQGIESSDVEAVANRLADELTAFQKEHPMIALIGVFALGCIVGRAFK